MSGSAFVRMRDEYAVALILAALLAFFIAFIPNYQRNAYRDTAPIAYSPMMKTDSVGYPSTDSFPTVDSIAEIKYKNMLKEKSGLSSVESYIDMACNWREGEEAKRIENIRYLIVTVVFIGSWIIFSVLELLIIMILEEPEDFLSQN